jgi:hypothetical protein
MLRDMINRQSYNIYHVALRSRRWGGILPHRHPTTTQIYVKLDVGAWQALAWSWLEEVQ